LERDHIPRRGLPVFGEKQRRPILDLLADRVRPEPQLGAVIAFDQRVGRPDAKGAGRAAGEVRDELGRIGAADMKGVVDPGRSRSRLRMPPASAVTAASIRASSSSIQSLAAP
jgi:hypothetical protein